MRKLCAQKLIFKQICNGKIIFRIIPLLYFEQNLTEETKITYKSILHRDQYSALTIENSLETNIKMRQQVENLPFPYKSGPLKADLLMEKSLSRIISKLYRKLLTQSTKYYTVIALTSF